jgi:hypothetical protein
LPTCFIVSNWREEIHGVVESEVQLRNKAEKVLPGPYYSVRFEWLQSLGDMPINLVGCLRGKISNRLSNTWANNVSTWSKHVSNCDSGVAIAGQLAEVSLAALASLPIAGLA